MGQHAHSHGSAPSRQKAVTWNRNDQVQHAGGCFNSVSRVLQNNLAKIHNARNHFYGENFKLKICTCAQSMALGTHTKFQLEILIRSTISAIHKFWKNILESSRNASETTPYMVSMVVSEKSFNQITRFSDMIKVCLYLPIQCHIFAVVMAVAGNLSLVLDTNAGCVPTLTTARPVSAVVVPTDTRLTSSLTPAAQQCMLGSRASLRRSRTIYQTAAGWLRIGSAVWSIWRCPQERVRPTSWLAAAGDTGRAQGHRERWDGWRSARLWYLECISTVERRVLLLEINWDVLLQILLMMISQHWS